MTIVADYINGLKQCLHEISEPCIIQAANIIFNATRNGGNIFIVGNGGSASTASHMACDLNTIKSDHYLPRVRAMALTDNITTISAWANDINYEAIFVEQLINFLKKGDVVIGISVSGNSQNVIRAVKFAKANGATTIGFAGFNGGYLKKITHICILVPSFGYCQVEDTHLALGHIISRLITIRTECNDFSHEKGKNDN